MMPKRSLSIFLILIISFLGLRAQVGIKHEFEQRVRPDQFPAEILNDLKPFTEKARRVRYFKEFNSENFSWEVKMVYGGRHFSIEYLENFEIKDIEELIRWRRVDSETRSAFIRFFEENYTRHRVKRFQKQYFPKQETDELQWIESVLSGSIHQPDGFELEVEIRSDREGLLGTYEFQFDKDFNLVSKRKIVPLPHDNLVF